MRYGSASQYTSPQIRRLAPSAAALLAAAIAFASQSGCASPEEIHQAKVAQVQSDVRKLTNASFEDDVHTIMKFTYPTFIIVLGGPEKAKEKVHAWMRLRTRGGLKLQSLELVGEPKFFRGTKNEFVIQKVKFSMVAPDRRIDAESYHLGVRTIGNIKWWYLNGQLLKREHLEKIFDDFPAEIELPTSSQDKTDIKQDSET